MQHFAELQENCNECYKDTCGPYKQTVYDVSTSYKQKIVDLVNNLGKLYVECEEKLEFSLFNIDAIQKKKN